MTQSVETRSELNIRSLSEHRQAKERQRSLTHTFKTAQDRDGALIYIWNPSKRLELMLKPPTIGKGYEMECVDPRRCMSHLDQASLSMAA